jgi:outer membrane receptor for ferrienterochelin and colicins|tara:strand:- start:1084 stop:3171 length:2088 start_codon:yes stop_codon:yes gene_type:complete
MRFVILFCFIVTNTFSQSDAKVSYPQKDSVVNLEDIVVTATKTPKRKTNSPILINIINSEVIRNVQACNLSESLSFQTGLRVETDCQTCNYTQLRINGMSGGFTQILINGRPTFSPLMGLYALEQLPSNMIEKIEVMKGGGSTLYGSSAIGGTVNIITKIPKENNSQIEFATHLIDQQSNDYSVLGNASIVSESKKAGLSLFVNKRDREAYDSNNDRFSELPQLNNLSFGANMYFLPMENQKLDINFNSVYEYRYGGEMPVQNPSHFANQSEERTHRIFMANIDYQINFNNYNSSLITYLAYQNTNREHYTGIKPDDDIKLDIFLKKPPYGDSYVKTLNTGLQLNHMVNPFFSGDNLLTLGIDYLHDSVFDEINAYNYHVDQVSKDLGIFLQSDWEINQKLSFLNGLRADFHNFVDKTIFSLRASMLYKANDDLQFRFGYGTGFRAPQALDTDLHIAFAGGGISRVTLSPKLKEEKSESFNLSMNYDKAKENWIAGFTFDLFYTRLINAFILKPIGQDAFGEVFEKQNGQGALIKGINFEARANFNSVVQLEGGYTVQSSNFDNSVEYIKGIPAIKEFIRTPDTYGYAVLTYTNKNISSTVNYVYTGSMKVPHFAGAPNQLIDEIVTTDSFSELSLKFNYTISAASVSLDLYTGIKNIFNDYQRDFDIGKNRDSNYIYGPAQPKTTYFGVRLSFN